jgi:sulfur relay (sulfurtransferase) complex TusBCD TusD component (DsrE family)
VTAGPPPSPRHTLRSERSAVKILAVLEGHPGATPRSAALLRLAVELVAWRDDLDVTLLLDGRALRLAVGDLPERTGRYSVAHLVECVAARGTVAASAVGLEERGIDIAVLRPGVEPLTAEEMEELTEEADRVLVL